MDGLKIGDAARLAGVSTRAVRHYHAMGLLPEPARSSSGYRLYREQDIVALVRVARLRTLHMSIAQIRANENTDAGGLVESLRALADEMDREIHRLQENRDRLRQLADSEAVNDPTHTLTDALRNHRLLSEDGSLAPEEQAAAELVDALSAGGIEEVLEQASTMLTDPDVLTRLRPLIARVRALDEDSSDREIESLARDFAEVLPRPIDPAPSVDIDTMDGLLGGRLTPAQRRVMRLMRRDMDAGDK